MTRKLLLYNSSIISAFHSGRSCNLKMFFCFHLPRLMTLWTALHTNLALCFCHQGESWWWWLEKLGQLHMDTSAWIIISRKIRHIFLSLYLAESNKHEKSEKFVAIRRVDAQQPIRRVHFTFKVSQPMKIARTSKPMNRFHF